MDEKFVEIVIKNGIRTIYTIDETLGALTIGDLKRKILNDNGLPEAELKVCDESFKIESKIKMSIPKDDVSFMEVENDLEEEIDGGRVVKKLIFASENMEDRIRFLEIQVSRMVAIEQYDDEVTSLKERVSELEEENKMLRGGGGVLGRKTEDFYGGGRMMDNGNQFAMPRQQYPPAFRPDGKDNLSRQKSKSVFIRNLAYKVTDEELRKFVSQFGFLESCYILRHGPRRLSSGKAKATFGSIEDAEKCVILMNGKMIGDRNVLVDFSQN